MVAGELSGDQVGKKDMGTESLGVAVDGAPQSASERADRAHTYAVVIGIDRYPGFGDLQGACNDATAFYEWAVDPSGGDVPERNARLRLSGRARTPRGARPLKREIDRDLEDLVGIARRSPEPSRLYMFFSGHGVAPLQSSAAGVMANAIASRCWNLSFSTYLEWFRRCRDFAEIVMLSDCCRTATDVPAGAPQYDTCSPGPRHRQSRLVAHATDMDHQAFEARAPDDVVRGFFTAALLEGLRGAAADPRSGMVDAASLARFLPDDVKRRSGGRQWPDIEPSYPPLVLAEHPPAARSVFDVTVTVTDGPSRPLRIVDGGDADAITVSPPGETFTVRLPNGLYELQDAEGRSVRFAVDGAPRHVDARDATGGA